MENVRKHRDIKLTTTERRRNYFVPEASYHTTNFLKKICRIEKKKYNRKEES